MATNLSREDELRESSVMLLANALLIVDKLIPFPTCF